LVFGHVLGDALAVGHGGHGHVAGGHGGCHVVGLDVTRARGQYLNLTRQYVVHTLIR
jgi:hypothetical protein